MKNSRSRTSIWLLLPLAAGLALTSFSAIQEGDADSEPVIQDHESGSQKAGQLSAEENHERFEKSMKDLNRGQKSLRRLLGDARANQAAILSILENMESQALIVYQLTPPKPETEMTGPEWELHKIGYKSGILEMQATLLRMQMAALRADSDTLNKQYQALQANKKEGHDKYKFD